MKRKGPHPSDALNEALIRALRVPGLYADGKGLYLRVDNTGAKRWILRTMVQGKRRDLGLGGLRTTTLAEARQKAQACRTIARAGGDPTRALRPIPAGIVDGHDFR